MTDTVSVRVTDGDVWIDGEHLTRGDETEIPESVYERIPESFDRLGSEGDDTPDDAGEDEDVDEDGAAADEEGADIDESEAEPSDLDVDVDAIDPHPKDLTVVELKERVAGVDDEDVARGIRFLEKRDGPRSTAIDAINARLDELTE